MREYPIHVTWVQGKTPNTLCITWGSKKKFWQTIYNSNYTHTNIQKYYNENIHVM